MDIVAKVAAITAGDDDDAKQSLRMFLHIADIVTATSALQVAAEKLRDGAPVDNETLVRRLDGFSNVILQALDGMLAEYSGESSGKRAVFH